MAKLGVALTEGRTGACGGSSSADVHMANGCTGGGGAHEPDQAAAEVADADGCAVRPAAFKALVGRGHSEFQSNRQQVGGSCCCHDGLCSEASVCGLPCHSTCGLGRAALP